MFENTISPEGRLFQIHFVGSTFIMGRKNKPGEHAQTFRLPSDVWQNLCRSAENNLRSRNGELVWILREWFKDRGKTRSDGPSESAGRPSGS